LGEYGFKNEKAIKNNRFRVKPDPNPITHLENNVNICIFIFIGKKENTKDFGRKLSLLFKIDKMDSLY